MIELWDFGRGTGGEFGFVKIFSSFAWKKEEWKKAEKVQNKIFIIKKLL